MPNATQTRTHYDIQSEVSAAKVAAEGERTVTQLTGELGIRDSTLRRRAEEYEELGRVARPGNESPKVNKGYEKAGLRRQVEELGTGNELPRYYRTLSGRSRT